VTGDVNHDMRPWGEYFVLSDEPTYKVKRIVVHPGCRLSYQRHERRSEHWIVVSGRGVVTLDGTERNVASGDCIDVPTGAAHRVACTSDQDFVFVEVQLGSYFGEDDIQRLADDYGRAGETYDGHR
jgi:mannose-6-phosphate isomerase